MKRRFLSENPLSQIFRPRDNHFIQFSKFMQLTTNQTRLDFCVDRFLQQALSYLHDR